MFLSSRKEQFTIIIKKISTVASLIFTKRTNKRCSLLREKIYYEEGRLVLPGEKKPFWVARYNCNGGAIGTAYKAVRGEQEENGGEEKLLATFDFATWSNRGDADFFFSFPPSRRVNSNSAR